MTSQRRIQCHGKKRYVTITLARKAIRLMKRRSNLTGLGAYRCPYCQGWHVGSSEQPADWEGLEQHRH
jgi:hypothetical protein